MNGERSRAPLILLGLLTATQVGIGAWRAIVLLRDAHAAGVRPLAWSAELGLDLLTCALLAAIAWWWLPPQSRRDAAAWGVRFLLLSWLLSLAHYVWALATGHLAPQLTWIVFAVLFAAGWWSRRQGAALEPSPKIPSILPLSSRLAFALAAVFFAAQLPHLVFNYSFTDAKVTWACRAFKLAERGSLTGILDCANPAMAPLHAITLWLGVRDPTFEGRLLPLLMFGAFALVFYGLLRRVAPRLAPWGVVWLLATDHVLKGQVSTYSGVPEMLAIVIALAVAIDERAVAPTRSFAVLLAAVAGALVALLRRDGFPEFLVAAAALVVVTRGWRDTRLWAAIGAACIAYIAWAARPDWLQALPAFPPRIGSLGVLYQVAASPTAVQRLRTLLNGAQGQLFSHYGYAAFVWSWLIVAVWCRWVRLRAPMMSASTLYGVAGLSGWVATLGAYVVLMLIGHAYMTSLLVVRTGFGRHLVHFFPLCLLHATALAERLATARGHA